MDETKLVFTRDDYFRVRGNGAVDRHAHGMYVLGDTVAGSNDTVMKLDAMMPVVCSSIDVDIAAQYESAEGGQTPKLGFLQTLLRLLPGTTAQSTGTLTQKECKLMKDTIVVHISPDIGRGELFGWHVPGWFVRMAKGKLLLIQMMGLWVSVEKWKT